MNMNKKKFIYHYKTYLQKFYHLVKVDKCILNNFSLIKTFKLNIHYNRVVFSLINLKPINN